MEDESPGVEARGESRSRTHSPRGGVGGWWRRQSTWLRRFALVVGVLLILQPIVGFLIVPLVIRTIVVPQIAKRIDGDIRLAGATFNPYTWNLGLTGLAVADPDGHDALGFEHAEINFHPILSLVRPGWRFGDVVLTAPFVDATRSRDLGLNLLRIVGQRVTSQPAADLKSLHVPHLVIGLLAIENGRLVLDDQTFAEPIVTEISGFTAHLDNLDTIPTHEHVYSCVATLDGGATIEWQGSLSLDPPESAGTIEIRQLRLERVGSYATRYTDATIGEGVLDAMVSYRFEPVAAQPMVRATIGSATITELAADREDGPLVRAPRVELGRSDVDLLARNVDVGRLAIRGATLKVDRDEEGTLNLAKLVRSRPPSAVAGAEDQDSSSAQERVDVTQLTDPAQQLLTAVSYILQDITGAWSFAVESVEIADQSIDFSDRSPPEPVRAELRQLALTAGPVRSDEGFVIPFRTELRLNDAPSGGEGSFGVRERTFDAHLRTDGLGLAAFGPYIRLIGAEPFASTKVVDGSLEADGQLKLATPTVERIDGTWKGSLTVHSLGTTHVGSGDEVINAASIAIEGDASASVSSTEGARAAWSGTLDGTTGAAGPALISTLGLGDGSLALGALHIEGAVDLASELSGDIHGSWKGVIGFEGLDAKNLAAGGELRAALARLSLDAGAEYQIPKGGGASATWDGTIALKDLDAGAGGASPVATTLGELGIRGRGSVGFGADGSAQLGWDGEATLAALNATLSAIEIVADADDASLKGKIKLARNEGTPASLAWQGVMRLGAARVVHDSPDNGLRISESRTSLDGTLAAALASSGDLTATLGGTIGLESPSIVVTTAEGREQKFGATTLALKGDGEAAREGETRRLNWNGRADVDGAEASLSRAAGDIAATLAALGAEGEFSLDSEGSSVTLAWKGSHDGQTVDASLASAEMPTHAQLAGFSGASDVSATIRSDGLDASWHGAVDASEAMLDATISETPTRATATSLRLEGDAAAKQEGDGSPGLSWRGAAEAHGAEASRASGADRITAGGESLRFDGSLDLTPTADSSTLSTKGTLAIASATAAKGDPAEASAAVKSIELSGISLDEAASLLALDRLAIGGAAMVYEVPASSGEKTETPAPLENLAEMLPFAVHLREFHLEDGSLAVTAPDVVATPSTSETPLVDQIVLDASDLSTDGTSVGKLDLTSRIGGSGRLAVTGTLDPFRQPLVADLLITIDGAPIPPANPLAARYLGWNTSAGRLNTEIPTTVQDGKVNGTLNFMLEGVELAGRSGHPDAPDLPLDFALAIMKDSKQQVKGSIPFSGDATDPNFSLTGLIIDVVLGFVGKVATAPFQLILAAVEGAGDTDLSMVAFEPGSAELDSAARKAADLLTKAMNERPEVTVSVLGHYSSEKDSRAIRLAALKSAVAARAARGFPPRRNVSDSIYREIVTTMWADTPEGAAARRAKEIPSFDAIEDAMLATMPFEESSLHELAQQRADAIADALRAAGVAPSRITARPAEDSALNAATPRATLELGFAGEGAGGRAGSDSTGP